MRNSILDICKKIMLCLEFNPEDEHHAFLKEQLLEFGMHEHEFPLAWQTIKKVWASKFNERAFLATQKQGISLD